jgi:hypothetical protein
MKTNILSIQNHPFGDLTFVGDLLFRLYPTTSVYSNSENDVIILEWADQNDTGENIYFIYQVSPLHLKKYIGLELSHLNLIYSAVSEIALVFSGELEQTKQFSIVNIRELDSTFLPFEDAFFIPEESDDLEIISDHFRLNEIDLDEAPLDLPIDVLNLHLKEGKSVGFGKADTRVLGNVLSNFEELYNEVAKDHIRGVNRDIRISRADKQYLEELSQTEVTRVIAASLSLFIKPKKNQVRQQEIEGQIVERDDAIILFEKLGDLIENSHTEEKIKAIKDSYSAPVFQKLQSFAQTVTKNDLSININYRPSENAKARQLNINKVSGNKIIDSVVSTSTNTEETLNVIGKFTAINCRTKHFSFINEDESEEFTGYFDQVLGGLERLNFTTNYKIKIHRTIFFDRGNRNRQPRIWILSYEIYNG